MLAITAREGQENAVSVFDTRSRTRVARIVTEQAPSGIAISSSQRYLAATFRTAGVRVFSLPGGEEVSLVSASENEQVGSLIFSKDERTVVFVSRWSPSEESFGDSEEAGIRREYLHADDLVLEACARTGRRLTKDEWKTYLPQYDYRDTCAGVSSAAAR